MTYHAPLSATLFPAVLGIILYLAGRGIGKKIRWLATSIAFLSVLLILSMAPQLIVYHQNGGKPINSRVAIATADRQSTPTISAGRLRISKDSTNT